MTQNKKVALLIGGWNAEREVSIDKGKHVERALIDGGYDVSVIDVTRDIQKLLHDITIAAPDVVFNNIYGRIGEDGTLQGLLEMLEIPYTNSGVMASAIAMDKPMAKKMMQMVGGNVPKGGLATREETLLESIAPSPYVIKPYNEGSSFDTYIIKDGNDTAPILDNWNYGDHALIEEYIPGKELTVAVLDGKAQGVTEIISHAQDFFDYEAKYEDDQTELVLPAKIPQDVYQAALDLSEKVYNIIGCHGLARCDYRYDDTKGVEGLYFLEINNPPGMTAESIGPSQCVYNGMSFVQLCSHLVETAKCHGLVNYSIKSA